MPASTSAPEASSFLDALNFNSDDLGNAKAAVKEFKKGLKAERWQDRRDAYLTVADYDSGPVAKAVLDAALKEKNPAVRLNALRVLGGLASDGAKAYLAAEAKKARGARKQFVLMVLSKQEGEDVTALLREILKGKDGMTIAQAAIALGESEAKEAIPDLADLLGHKDWQVRRAAAMARPMP